MPSVTAPVEGPASGEGEQTVNRLARMMAPTLALLCLFTIGAGAAVARLLPPRLALFELPTISARGPASPGTVLRCATGSPAAGSGSDATATGGPRSLARRSTP